MKVHHATQVAEVALQPIWPRDPEIQILIHKLDKIIILLGKLYAGFFL